MQMERILSSATTTPNICLDFVTLSQNIVRSWQLQQLLEQGKPMPFNEVFNCASGDGQLEGQKPMTFIRQILALCSCPELLTSDEFPDDVKQRAERLLAAFNGSHPYRDGNELLRKDVVAFLNRRDKLSTKLENIIITNGATEAVRLLLKVVNVTLSGKRSAVLCPIPQFPLFKATLLEYSMYHAAYYMDEDRDWDVPIPHLKQVLESVKGHSEPRALIIVNPGNPSSQVLSRGKMEEIIRFAHDEKLLLIADEAYQWNCYDDDFPFVSFKKVILDMEAPYNATECAAVFTLSKGYIGECGMRGGFVELINLEPDIVNEIAMSHFATSKVASVSAQIAMSAATNVPQPGDPSYDTFKMEHDIIYKDLQDRAKMMCEGLNAIEGVMCPPVRGSWFAYARIHFPAKFVQFAKSKNKEPDDLYTTELLEKTGLAIVPGISFGQLPETYHIRFSILMTMERQMKALALLQKFHVEYLTQYK